jgi:transcriptional regulator with XRE-family HTH domain
LSIEKEKYIKNNIKMPLEKLVIDNIKRIRKEKRISQEKLAEACNTATSYIGLMEIYRNVPKLSTIEKIASALDVDPIILFQNSYQLPAKKEAELKAIKNQILEKIEKEIDAVLRRNIVAIS